MQGCFVGPRREMITPWSTNAVEITQNMGIEGITRIEQFFAEGASGVQFDPMLNRRYEILDQKIYTIEKQSDPIVYIEDLKGYNQTEGLALSEKEIEYLEEVAEKLGRNLTDSEVFGFSAIVTFIMLILDMEGISFMDSSGIALVIGAYKRATSVGSSFCVINVSKQAYKVFSAAGICKLLNISEREKDKVNI